MALHPRALIHDSFLDGPGICIELYDYLWVILSHGLCQLSPLPPGNLLLEFWVLPFSQLDSSLFEERPTLDRFEAALMLLASETVSIKLDLCLWGYTESLPCGILPCPFSEKLLWSHYLQRHIHKKLVCMKYATIISVIYPKQARSQSTLGVFPLFLFVNCMCYRATNKTNHNSVHIILKEINTLYQSRCNVPLHGVASFNQQLD